MSIQLSTSVRNARLDVIETTIGTSAKLIIRTGSAPANCSTADSGTLLAIVPCPSDWLAAASSGSKVLAGSWTVSAAGTGTAAHFRIKDSTATSSDNTGTTHIQGSVTATGGGGDMTLDNTSIASAQTVTITTFTLTDGNA